VNSESNGDSTGAGISCSEKLLSGKKYSSVTLCSACQFQQAIRSCGANAGAAGRGKGIGGLGLSALPAQHQEHESNADKPGFQVPSLRNFFHVVLFSSIY